MANIYDRLERHCIHAGASSNYIDIIHQLLDRLDEAGPAADVKIVEFNGITVLDLKPEKVLAALAKEKDIDAVFLICERSSEILKGTRTTTRTYHATFVDSNVSLRWIEEFKFKLLRGDFSE